MTSEASLKAKQTIFSAPQGLTRLEIESLRAHKEELMRKIPEIRARQLVDRKEAAE